MSRIAYVDSRYVPRRVRIDGGPLGSGVPGPLARRLRERYLAYVTEAA
jgi:hypothetical protein